MRRLLRLPGAPAARGGSGSSDPWEEPESPGSPQNPADPGSPDVPEEPLPPGAVTYTVTFIANAPEGESASGEMEPQVFAEGQERVLSANAFSVAGYTFKGWAADASAEEPLYTDRQQVLISADTQLYAVWGKADAENPDAPSSDGLSVDGDGNLVVEDAAAVKPDVRIPDGVKSIGGSNAFIDGSFCGIYTGFKSITIPASVEEITREAFTDSRDLGFMIMHDKRTKPLPFKFIVDEKNQHFKTNASGNMLLSKDGTVLYFVTNSSDDFTIPATVTEIADCAFIYTNIKHLNLNGIKFNNNGTGLFENSPELETVVLKNITAEYTASMFTNCPKLRSANLSEAGNITDAQGMFSYCTSLTEVTLPDSVTTLDCTFNGCTSLTKFTIPDSTTKIYMYELGNNRSLTVTYPKSIDDYRQISNSNVNKHFSPDAFGGDVNVTVTCADGKKVIYTSDGTMKEE